MSILVERKINILDFEAWLNQCSNVYNGSFSKTSDSITLTSTADDCYTQTYADSGMLLSAQANTEYEMSLDFEGEGTPRILIFVGNSGTPLTESTESPIVFTTPSGCTSIKVRLGIKEGSKTITFSNVKIETTITKECDYEQKIGCYPNLMDEPSLLNFDSPYPYSIITQKQGEYPKYSHLNLLSMGAFANAYKLTYVRIPETVKKIGEYAFRNTALTSVTIARDCEYYPTSFPGGCKINFY